MAWCHPLSERDLKSTRIVSMAQKDQDLPTGRVNYTKAPMTSPNKAGTPTKSPHNVGGINKPMGDGLTKPQTQWTKRS